MLRTICLTAGLAVGTAAPFAPGQPGGPSGPPAPYVPPRMSMPRAFVPPAPMSGAGRHFRPPPYSIPPRTGSGLTRPLPLNFGGVKAKLPGPIGSLKTPPVTNPWPGHPDHHHRGGGPGGGGVGIIIADGDGGGRVIRGGDFWDHARDPLPDSGFSGHIGTSGVSLGYRSSGSGFSFATSINNSANVAVINAGLSLGTGRHSLWKQRGWCSPYSWGTGWGSWYNDYPYPIYTPIWPYPDPLLSTYYTPPAPAAQPDPATAGQPQPTLLEQAEILMGYEHFEDAVAAYREHLSERSDDAEALRMLAVALVLDRRPREAGEAMLAAYRMNPALADNPVVLPPGLGPSDLASAANRAIEHAQRTRTAPAWLAAAVLTQARDKPAVARNFAKSAKAAGLDPEVYARLMSSWSS